MNQVRSLLLKFDTTLSIMTPLTNMAMGAGVAYALDNGDYRELPLAILMPSVYVGYKLAKNRDKLKLPKCINDE